MTWLLVKWVHVISATLLFGTGVGSAFYLFVASLRRPAEEAAAVARLVVWADWCFTAPTIVLQPLTGLWLASSVGLDWHTRWIAESLVWWAVSTLLWLVVVGLQYRLARDATARPEPARLPASYRRALVAWITLGALALIAYLRIFWLMIAKPA